MYTVEYSPESLRDIMNAKKMTSKRLADESNLCARYISLLKHGKSIPTITTVRKIGSVLGVTFI